MAVHLVDRLVVVMPADNPAGLVNLGDLAESGVKLVLADPVVPVGRYSLDFLAKASQRPQYGETFSQAVLANVVSYEDNVKAVLSKVLLGEADAGIVYVSDIGPQNRAKVARIDIPDDPNVVATYPLAPVSDSRQPELAQAFVAFGLSPVGSKY